MIKLTSHGVFIDNKYNVINEGNQSECLKNTLAYKIMQAHNQCNDMENLRLKFDALVSPDNNYVSILQTVVACGVKKFPVPYVLSNCHNTLCAVGGTINEDDHVFGLDNAKKYGGIFLPTYKAVIHQFMRENMAGGGKMILGSDSHTRYGVLGTLSIGEGGGEVAKQLLSQTYDIKRPDIIGVKLIGVPKKGVGPLDVALTLIGATFQNGFVKNKILEFFGDGVHNLSVEFRMGIDVMTTESATLSSIWISDEKVAEYLKDHQRQDDYKELKLQDTAYYNGLIEIDLATVECMMAMPYHPSNVISINEFNQNPEQFLKEIEQKGRQKSSGFKIMDKIHNGKLHIDQALVSGCAGGMFENIVAMADILADTTISGDASCLGINPSSQPIFMELSRFGVINKLIEAGATIRPCICGPCFGVSDVPANNQISIRHVTRNYPNREGTKPNNAQMAASFLMDARSIAATIRNGGYIAPATEFEVEYSDYKYNYSKNYYAKQVYNNFGTPNSEVEIRKGNNIADWPTIYKMNKHLLLKVSGVYTEPVTTDDLSPSGDAVAFRSNPIKLAEFTMINKDKEYVSRAKTILKEETARKENGSDKIIQEICAKLSCNKEDITIGSVMVGDQIGDGSSREQATSSQKILGGYANIAKEFATKRYRSNLINWGLLPIISDNQEDIKQDDYLLIKDIDLVIQNAGQSIEIQNITSGKTILGNIGSMNDKEKQILIEGCLINYNKSMVK
ncbi:hydratase [Candidatus Epulonipiscium fishelsonii]|uniref:Hydratase n=1 Tax=Candidatus Epulonipiscium fishelsonii TaxID=77094 RepID=A0ACC8XEH5_9FIRM|nr:hydratase [Epulopiscium sp. SCG-D08WGA-EpuloA1]